MEVQSSLAAGQLEGPGPHPHSATMPCFPCQLFVPILSLGVAPAGGSFHLGLFTVPSSALPGASASPWCLSRVLLENSPTC